MRNNWQAGSLLEKILWIYGVDVRSGEVIYFSRRIMFCAIAVSWMYTWAYILTCYDYVTRPAYQSYVLSASFLADIASTLCLYRWTLQHVKPLSDQLKLRWHPIDDFLILFFGSIYVWITCDVYIEISEDNAIYQTVGDYGFITLQAIYFTGIDFPAIVLRVFLSRLIATASDDLGKLVKLTEIYLPSIYCEVECYLANIQRLISYTIFVVYADYFVILTAQFAGELVPSMCAMSYVVFTALRTVVFVGVYILIVSRACTLQKHLKDLRRRLRLWQLQFEPERDKPAAIIEMCGCLSLEKSEHLGLSYFYATSIVRWRSVVNFVVFSWSYAFLLLQLVLQHALLDWDRFCTAPERL